MRWWIEGAQINWELGIARLTGGYESPIMQTFVALARSHFENVTAEKGARKVKPKPNKKARTRT